MHHPLLGPGPKSTRMGCWGLGQAAARGLQARGSVFYDPRRPTAPRCWPSIDSLPFYSSVAGRQKRNVPTEEAPFPKRYAIF